MTDYDIDIRSLEPEYKHTFARQANREVDDGRELHLSRFTVTVRLAWGSGSNYGCQTFDAAFNVDHEAGGVRLTTVGDAHAERQSFSMEKLLTAIEYAERAAVAFLEHVGPDYYLVDGIDLLEGIRQQTTGDDARVHTALEVTGGD